MKSSVFGVFALFGFRGGRWPVVLAILLPGSLAIAAAIFVTSRKPLTHEDFATETYHLHLVRANQILVKFRVSGPDIRRKQAEDLVNRIRAGRWDVRSIGHNGAFVVQSLDKFKV